MGDLTDPQRYDEKLDNQLEKLETADITDDDRDEIHRYIRHLTADGDVNAGTIVSRLNRLRLASERATTPLTDMDSEAVDELLFRLNREYELADGTLRNYRKALRAFFQFRDEPWADDIRIGASPDRTVDPNDLLDMDEITALIDAASNHRDKALIALLADSGLRIGAVASLRIRDVDFSGPTASVSVNEDANVKGASGTTPLTWSEGYVAKWLDIHPRRDDEDAPLLHVRDGWYDGDGDGSLDYQYLARRIRNVADSAGIERDRVNTHNFRKSAISRWIREGMSEQAIKHRAHWDVDTDQFETYSGVRGEELNDQILAHYGIESEDAPRPDIDQCPRCGTPLRGDESFCASCAAPLTDRAAARTDDAEEEIFDSVAADDLANAELLRMLRERFESDPDFRRIFAGGHESSSSSN